MLNLFFKFRFILVLACLKNYKRHDAKFCSVKCFERVHVLQMSPVHVLQMSPVHVLQMSPVHVLQMSPVHVLQMSPVHVLQMSPVQVLQMSPVHVLQISPVQVLQMSPVQVLQVQSSPCFTTCPLDIASSETIIFLEISFLKIVKKSIFLLNISCLIFDSTKTIRLLALNFYEMIVDQISSS